MAEQGAQVVSLNVPHFEEWVDENDAIIELMKIRFRKRGIELTDLEAWQYLGWGLSATLQAAAQVGGEGMVRGLEAIKYQVSEVCARAFRQYKTGVWEPPTGMRFDTPDEYEQARSGKVSKETPPVFTTAAVKHDGYL